MPRLWMPSMLLTLLCTHALAAEPDTTRHDLSYSVGASLGQRLREEMPDVDVQVLAEALRKAYQGQPLDLTQARMDQVLADHEKQTAQTQSGSQVEQALLEERKFFARERAKAGMHELAGGMIYQELVPGSGDKPLAGGKVEVRYAGWLPDGTQFDRNDQPQWFAMDSVIEGWRDALQQMPKGARWRLVIPSRLAYGADGAGALIPPYSPLVFEIELVDVKN